MAMIQVGVASPPIQALTFVSRNYGDLNAFSRSLDSIEPGPEESPKTRPQGPISAGGFDRWIVIIRQQFSRWFKLITCSACCYVVTEDGIHNKSRREYPTKFDPRPVRDIFQFVGMRMMTSLARANRKNLAETAVDISRTAQLHDIEASFGACATNFDLTSLKNANKPNVTPVASYEIFPNVEIWANTYDLFRFSERPGERPPDVRVLGYGLVMGLWSSSHDFFFLGRRSPVGLCYYATYGVGWRSLPIVLLDAEG